MMPPETNLDNSLRFIAHYPPNVQEQAKGLLISGRLGPWLNERHGKPHPYRSNQLVYEYAQDIKQSFLRKAPPLHSVTYNDKALRSHDALGINVKRTRQHGRKQPVRREIIVDTLFKDVSEPLLRMILAHEIAHIREADHDKAFYNLCCHIEPDYHQLEFEMRLLLVYRSHEGCLPF